MNEEQRRRLQEAVEFIEGGGLEVKPVRLRPGIAVELLAGEVVKLRDVITTPIADTVTIRPSQAEHLPRGVQVISCEAKKWTSGSV